MYRLLWIFIFLASFWARADSEQQRIPMQTYGAHAFYIESEIPGAGHFPMLVDTGSAYSVINEETLSRLNNKGQAHFIKNLRGTMADGSERVIALYRISAINLGGNCLIKDVHAAIMPGKTRQIIGISTLMRAAPFAMSFDPPMLSLAQCVPQAQQASLELVEMADGSTH